MAWGSTSPRREPVLRVGPASNHPGEPGPRPAFSTDPIERAL